MAEEQTNTVATNDEEKAPKGRTQDEIALELMKFIATATGYGKSTQASAGFSGKPQTRSAEEHAEALLDLYDRCRRAVKKEV